MSKTQTNRKTMDITMPDSGIQWTKPNFLLKKGAERQPKSLLSIVLSQFCEAYQQATLEMPCRMLT